MSWREELGLPILDELERDVQRAAELAEAADRAPRRPTPARGPGRQLPRVVRRALVLAALALTLGATAVATTGVLEGEDPAVAGPSVQAAQGAAGGGYRLLLHPRRASLCTVLVAGGGVASQCRRPPRGAEVQPLSALGADRRFVFGVAGPTAGRVRIRVGERQARVATRRIPAAAAREAGIDPRLRTFVASFPPRLASASQPPAIVGGRFDCSLTIDPNPACELR